jgi:carboxylate-amine ligase
VIERPAFTVGIEEEYLIVDPDTRDLVGNPGGSFMAECAELLGPRVSPELLKAQVEVVTSPAKDIGGAGEELRSLRSAVCDIAERHGFRVIAASTHPFAQWAAQEITDKERYLMLAQDLQGVVRRLMICGMHVHVGIEDPDLRLDLMNQVVYFLPHLLAMSTSSPFWDGGDTGLKSYRMAVFYSMPRTGLPEPFSSWAEYQRHVAVLRDGGVIEDASRLWWDIRPSARYPTIEMRISDVCTRIDDGLTIAAVFQSLLGMLFRRRQENQRWRTYATMLIRENVWRAQRYGVEATLMDFGRGVLVPYPDLVDEIVELVRVDAEELGCLDHVLRAPLIAAQGTSADRQLAAFRAVVDTGGSVQEGLIAVVDELIMDTKTGL